MNWIIICTIFSAVSIVPMVVAEMDFFPGLRRPPSMQNRLQSENDDEDRLLLAHISSIIEEQARRRFYQQLQIQQQLQQQQQQQQNFRTQSVSQDAIMPAVNTEFTYDFPVKQIENLDEDIPFAVSPSDPRYFDPTTQTIDNKHAKHLMKHNAEENNDYEEVTGGGAKDEDTVKSSSDGVPYFKLKAPMNVNPKFLEYPKSSQSRDIMTREEINGMLEKLKEHDHMKNKARSDVIQKPMEIDSVMGMYVVALVAGISAAITVGLISLGIAWYTLHKKSKAAADVEYPAYGVTGPNKDISPSGDRRLAQSAQMYHYQHQKQQIIAMENRSNNGDRNVSLSDVESDDENEEGDYTVYECPGLAPTGEMEVKNPLFLDDPTPATPANIITQQQSSPPSNQQQQSTKHSKNSPPGSGGTTTTTNNNNLNTTTQDKHDNKTSTEKNNKKK